MGYQTEYYSEKIQRHNTLSYYLHFYSIYRADEAIKKLSESDYDVIFIPHIEVDGLWGNKLKKEKKEKVKKEVDDEGFTFV